MLKVNKFDVFLINLRSSVENFFVFDFCLFSYISSDKIYTGFNYDYVNY